LTIFFCFGKIISEFGGIMKKMILLVLVFSALLLTAQNFNGMRILLFDGDNGRTFTNPDNSQQKIGYEYNFEKAFNYLGFKTDSNLIKSVSLPTSISGYLQYAAVFLVMGNGTPDNVKAADIALMKAYLDSGGCIFFEGNNVPYFLSQNYPAFIEDYFNNYCLDNGGTGYAGYDTLVTDTTDTTDPFYRLYKFVYPAYTAVDSSVDVIGPKLILTKIYYKSLLNYSYQGKLYKSTTSAYTPPETKAYYFPGKTIMQSVAFGAFADPHTLPNSLPDSIDNQLIRLSYLKDILAWFGIGNTLLVKDDRLPIGNDDDTLRAALTNLGIDYVRKTVPVNANGPSWTELMKYTYLIWFTGVDSTSSLTATDTVNLSVYLSYGGNFILSGENLAQDICSLGVQTNILSENTFMSLRLRVDYIGSTLDSRVYYANADGYYYGHAATKVCSLYAPTVGSNVDNIRPYLRGTHVDSTYYFISTKTKANNLVAISHQGIMHRTLFFGYCIEKIYYSDIASVLFYTYMQYFTSNLWFQPLTWDGTSESREKNIPSITEPVSKSPAAVYCDGMLYISGMEDCFLADVTGRNVLPLSNGRNCLKGKTKSGIYFIKGKVEGEPYSKSILVM